MSTMDELNTYSIKDLIILYNEIKEVNKNYKYIIGMDDLEGIVRSKIAKKTGQLLFW